MMRTTYPDPSHLRAGVLFLALVLDTGCAGRIETTIQMEMAEAPAMPLGSASGGPTGDPSPADRYATALATTGGLSGPLDSRFAPPGMGGGGDGGCFDLTRMRVLIVGIVNFQDTSVWENFEERGRKDKLLVEILLRRGLTPDRLVALHDSDATLARVQAALERQVAACRPGETLFVLGSSHGSLDAKGDGYLVPYDAGEVDEDQWSFPVVLDTIERGFRGDAVILALEACNSGSLVDALADLDTSRSYGVLTSTTTDEASTGNWTFTQSMIDGITGQAFVDEDRNGQVSFAELARHTRQQMLSFEDQIAPCATVGSFDGSMPVAAVRDGSTARPVGDAIEVFEGGEWWIARIVELRGSEVKVHWMDTGYDTRRDEVWVPRSSTRAIQSRRIPMSEALRAMPGAVPQA